jgi:peptidyl-prolyl cis-trans isomerase C
MQRPVLPLALLALLATLAGTAVADETKAPAPGAPPPATGKTFQANDTLVKVNGEAMPAIYAEFVRQARVAKNMPPEMTSLESLRDALVATALLAQDAKKQGLDKSPVLSAALEFQRMELLGKAAVEEYLKKHPIPEDQLKAEYDKAKAKAGDKEYRASHILVPTEKEAKTLLAQLKKPKVKFEDLARKHSKDSSAGKGGDLGWTVPANLVPEFAQAMTALKKGEVSAEPVQTQFGWHIIRLDDVRELAFPPYEEVKGRIAAQLQQAAIRRYVQTLRADAKVE